MPSSGKPCRISVFPRCKPVLCLLVSIPAALSALEVEVENHAGRILAGEILSVSGTHLFLKTRNAGSPLEVGLPLVEIASLSLIQKPPEGELLTRLEEHLPLLAYWEPSVLGKALQSVALLSETGDWLAAYRWTTRLLDIPLPENLRNDCSLQHAWTLYELGLHQQAAGEAARLAAGADPLSAPPRLCQLMAALAPNPEEARFWSLLPSLQIPSRPPRFSDPAQIPDTPHAPSPMPNPQSPK